MTVDGEENQFKRTGFAYRDNGHELILIFLDSQPEIMDSDLLAVAEPKITDVATLNAYLSSALSRLHNAFSDDPTRELFAWITFNTPVARTVLENIESTYSIEIVTLKIASSEGHVIDGWPPDDVWLQQLQDNLRSDPNLNNPAFLIEIGTIAAEIHGKVSALKEILDIVPEVYLVDIGPYEIIRDHGLKFPRIMLDTEDIYEEMSDYLGT